MPTDVGSTIKALTEETRAQKAELASLTDKYQARSAAARFRQPRVSGRVRADGRVAEPFGLRPPQVAEKTGKAQHQRIIYLTECSHTRSTRSALPTLRRARNMQPYKVAIAWARAHTPGDGPPMAPWGLHDRLDFISARLKDGAQRRSILNVRPPQPPSASRSQPNRDAAAVLFLAPQGGLLIAVWGPFRVIRRLCTEPRARHGMRAGVPACMHASHRIAALHRTAPHRMQDAGTLEAHARAAAKSAPERYALGAEPMVRPVAWTARTHTRARARLRCMPARMRTYMPMRAHTRTCTGAQACVRANAGVLVRSHRNAHARARTNAAQLPAVRCVPGAGGAGPTLLASPLPVCVVRFSCPRLLHAACHAKLAPEALQR